MGKPYEKFQGRSGETVRKISSTAWRELYTIRKTHARRSGVTLRKTHAWPNTNFTAQRTPCCESTGFFPTNPILQTLHPEKRCGTPSSTFLRNTLSCRTEHFIGLSLPQTASPQPPRASRGIAPKIPRASIPIKDTPSRPFSPYGHTPHLPFCFSAHPYCTFSKWQSEKQPRKQPEGNHPLSKTI